MILIQIMVTFKLEYAMRNRVLLILMDQFFLLSIKIDKYKNKQ